MRGLTSRTPELLCSGRGGALAGFRGFGGREPCSLPTSHSQEKRRRVPGALVRPDDPSLVRSAGRARAVALRCMRAANVPVVLLFPGLSGPAPAAPADRLDFSVIRDGQKICHRRIDLYQEGTRTRLDSDVDVRVSVAYFTGRFSMPITLWRPAMQRRLLPAKRIEDKNDGQAD
jgi:hypothetical protein